MKNMRRDEQPQQNNVAQIIASIPGIVWQAFFILCIALVLAAVASRYFPHTGLSAFMDALQSWLVRILLVFGLVIVGRLLRSIVPQIRAYRHNGRMMQAELILQERQAEKLQGETQKLDAERELHLASAERARREAESSMISAHATVYQARAQDKTAEGQRIRAEAERIRAEAEAERIRAEAEQLRAQTIIEVERERTRLLIEQEQSRLIRVSVTERLLYAENGAFRPVVDAVARQQIRNGHTESTLALPSAPLFRDMQHLITDKNHIPMAYAASKIVWGTVDKSLLSQLIVGMPGQGKSTALLYYLGVLLKCGTLPILFDPQGTLPELNGLLPYFGTLPEMIAAIIPITREIERRDAWYRRDRKDFEVNASPMLLLADEIPLIAKRESTYLEKNEIGVLDLIEQIVLEDRKYMCYSIIAGQSAPATILPTITRDNMSSRLVFLSKERQALTVGMDEKSRKVLMPVIEQAGVGSAILDMSDSREPLAVSIPFTTIEDIIDIIEADRERYQSWNDTLLSDMQATNITRMPGPRNLIPLEQNEIDEEQIPLLSGDMKRIYEACQQLASDGQRVSARAVESITGIDKDKANGIMNRLVDLGYITRSKAV